MRHHTSIEESKKLLGLGLDPNTADMYHFVSKDNEKVGVGFNIESYEEYKDCDIEYIPCWSSDALISVMPKYIVSRNGNKYPLEILPRDDGYFDVAYNANILAEIGFHYPSLISCLYHMMCWLYNNGYMNKK